ncbi:glycogen debranching protein [Prochlorococcus marinus]|uniref:Putative isoamylase n=1 Tax=Prochlorococcus marinus (strain MIT 9211) TaxID=93059 RepID=A9BBU5_PROM4|nr:isoamylase [Prochlorococcus marinus]ABX09307.1 Putative isoamylase [Prochlorococcus marinus str. MIT 9211]
MGKIHKGSPWPLGSSITSRGVNFSVASPEASYIELLIFKNEDDLQPKKILTLDKNHRSGDYWHIEVEGINTGCFYCYRVIGNRSTCKQDIFSRKILLDPCSRGIAGWNIFQRESATGLSTNIDKCLKSIVTERDQFDFQSYPRPKHSWDKTIIYELHVGGFTKSSESDVKDKIKGTFLGLIEKIPYLKQLGVTTLELLPVFAFDTTDSPYGLNNYWGYSPINWFTPHHSFIASNNPINARDQFRNFIKVCHKNDLEVILDVVYNHTTEGNEKGPIISWKGFAESTYYHQNKEGKYLDVTGCGNTIAANNPLVRQLILESMRCWANELGVDGFRFDLGISLSRGKDLKPLDSPPLFEEIESDPALSDLKLISEPWDCGGLYRLSDFPAKRCCTWNGHFRDDIRRFWNGDKNSTWPLKDRLTGSPELYKDNFKSAQKSINFITSHDGFTLKDLVSFNLKHNLSNGESNRDGENHNNSCNNGIEGPTTNKKVNLIRSKNQRNLIATLLLSPGIPMILMGDEVGRSQGGNNNAWCQDNPLGWMIWRTDNCDNELRSFVSMCIYIRKELSDFFAPLININSDSPSLQSQEKLWVQWHGVKINAPDWGSWSNTIGFSINKAKEGAIIWMGFNAFNQSMKFELPKPLSPWVKILDTTLLTQKEYGLFRLSNQLEIEIESKSLVVLVAKEYTKKLRI